MGQFVAETGDTIEGDTNDQLARLHYAEMILELSERAKTDAVSKETKAGFEQFSTRYQKSRINTVEIHYCWYPFVCVCVCVCVYLCVLCVLFASLRTQITQLGADLKPKAASKKAIAQFFADEFGRKTTTGKELWKRLKARHCTLCLPLCFHAKLLAAGSRESAQ